MKYSVRTRAADLTKDKLHLILERGRLPLTAPIEGFLPLEGTQVKVRLDGKVETVDIAGETIVC